MEKTEAKASKSARSLWCTRVTVSPCAARSGGFRGGWFRGGHAAGGRLSAAQEPCDHSIEQQDAHQHSILQRLALVGLDQPGIVDHAGDGTHVDGAVQPLPALSTRRRIHPRVEVMARGIISTNPKNPTVMYFRLATSSQTPYKSNDWSSQM